MGRDSEKINEISADGKASKRSNRVGNGMASDKVHKVGKYSESYKKMCKDSE